MFFAQWGDATTGMTITGGDRTLESTALITALRMVRNGETQDGAGVWERGVPWHGMAHRLVAVVRTDGTVRRLEE